MASGKAQLFSGEHGTFMNDNSTAKLCHLILIYIYMYMCEEFCVSFCSVSFLFLVVCT